MGAMAEQSAACKQASVLTELSQGRKIGSLESLMMKLEADKLRHERHMSLVKSGLSKLSSVSPGLLGSPLEVMAKLPAWQPPEPAAVAVKVPVIVEPEGAAPAPTPAPTSARAVVRQAVLSVSGASVQLEHQDEVMSIAFSPDSQLLLAGGEDSAITLWDISSRAQRFQRQVSVPIVAVAYAPSGQYLAAAGLEQVLVLDPAGNQVAEMTTENHIFCLAMSSAAGELLAIGFGESCVRLISIPGLEVLAELPTVGGVRSLSISPDGLVLAAGGGSDDAAGLLATTRSEGEVLKTLVFKRGPEPSTWKTAGFVAADGIVHAVTISPNGALLAIAGAKQMVEVVDLVSLTRDACLPCAAGVRTASWSSDSRYIASAGEDNKVYVWEISTQRLLFQISEAEDWICAVVFSPDIRWLAHAGFASNHVRMSPLQLEDGDPDIR